MGSWLVPQCRIHFAVAAIHLVPCSSSYWIRRQSDAFRTMMFMTLYSVSFFPFSSSVVVILNFFFTLSVDCTTRTGWSIVATALFLQISSNYAAFQNAWKFQRIEANGRHDARKVFWFIKLLKNIFICICIHSDETGSANDGLNVE